MGNEMDKFLEQMLLLDYFGEKKFCNSWQKKIEEMTKQKQKFDHINQITKKIQELQNELASELQSMKPVTVAKEQGAEKKEQ